MIKQFNMNIVWYLVLMVLCNGLPSNGVSTNVSTRPSVVNIGGIFSMGSIVSRVGRVAVEAAIEDINSDPSVLGGTKLRLTIQNSNFSGFLGIIEGMSYFLVQTFSFLT